MLLKWFRKLGRLLRGGAGRREILLGTVLGFILGMMPSLNFTVVLLVLSLLLFNANLAVALPAIAVARLVAITAAPLTFRIGYMLIHNSGLEPLFVQLAETPFLALMDFQVYCLTGALPVALVLGLILGLVFVSILFFLRNSLLQISHKSERLQNLLKSAPIRFILRVVFGPAVTADPSKTKRPVFRKGGVIFVAAMVILFMVAEWLFLDTLLASGVKTVLQLSTGAQVDVGAADLSLLQGRLELKDLAATDPQNPHLNLFETNHIAADLKIMDLLRKRSVFELIHVGRIATGTQRDKPGKVFRKEPVEPEPRLPDEKELSDYLADAEKIRDWLQKLQQYLQRMRSRQEAAKDEKPLSPEALQRRARALGYFALSAQDILTRRPTWTIERLLIENISIPALEDPRHLSAEMLSSHPYLNSAPMLLTVRPREEAPAELQLVLDFVQDGNMHEISVNMQDLEFTAESLLSEDMPFKVNSGIADIRADGTFSSTELEMPFTLNLRNLDLRMRQEQDNNTGTAARLLEQLQNIEIGGRLYGSLSRPRLHIQPPDVWNSMRESLLREGKQRLQDEAASELDKLKEKGAEELRGRFRGLLD